MRRDPVLFLGAFLGDRLVESVIASFDGRKGWVNQLAVDPHERRQGIGRKLTEEAERILKAHGAQVTAALVQTDNSPSLLLFEKCGYTAHKAILYLTKRDFPGGVGVDQNSGTGVFTKVSQLPCAIVGHHVEKSVMPDVGYWDDV